MENKKMPDITNGDGSAFHFDRKLDRINDTLAGLTTSMVVQREQLTLQRELADHQFALSEKRHELVMEELREMRELQREQRIDIMALFEGNKHLRTMLEQILAAAARIPDLPKQSAG